MTREDQKRSTDYQYRSLDPKTEASAKETHLVRKNDSRKHT